MITAVGWVRRGVAKRTPDHFEPSVDQLEELKKQADADALAFEAAEQENDEDEEDEDNEDEDDNNWEDDNAMDSDQPSTKPRKIAAQPEDLTEYNLDQYDEDPSALNIFGSLRGLQYHPSNAQDPYITLKDEADSDPENDDLAIEPTDNLILAAKTEDELSHLEVYVYEEAEDNLFLHHDIMLPSYPICLEWFNFDVHHPHSNPGSFVAMGTFQPEIEIWNLDIIDALYPFAVLGKNPDAQKPSAKRANKVHPQVHTDAVLCLSWNKNHRNMLASGSADTSLKLWDLSRASCLRSFSHHSDKVQACAWNPTETTVLLTGAYDKTAKVIDVRAPSAVSSWKLTADIEAAKWNPFNPQYFLASTEDGLITCFDARKSDSNPLFTLAAHDAAASSLDFNSVIPNCVVTCSFDKTVKIWDVENQKPSLIHTRDMGLGKLFSASFSPDSPFVIAVAGGKGKMEVFDSGQITTVRRQFEQRIITSSSSHLAGPAFGLTDHLAAHSAAVADAEAAMISTSDKPANDNHADKKKKKKAKKTSNNVQKK